MAFTQAEVALMKMNHARSNTLRLALLLTVAIVTSACGTVDPNVEDAEERSFVTATQSYEVQQGETFTVTIVAFERGSTSSIAPPPGTTITPTAGSGLEVIGGGVLVDGAMQFTLRARREGDHWVDVSAPGTSFEDDSFLVEVLGTDISVESSLATETTLGGFLFVPMIPGESTVAGFVLRGRGGCAIEGGASFGEADESGFDTAIRYAREFGPIRVAAAGGCPESDDGGVEAEIAYTAPDADATQGTVTYTIQADPVISKSITMLGIPGFDSRMVDVPTAVTGTFTRTDEGSCQPFEAGVFPLDWGVRALSQAQLEVTAPDGSAYQQTGNDGATYTFRSGATTVADDVQAVENVRIGFRLERGAGGALQFGISGTSRIDVTRVSTGQFICDQTADVEATAPIPPEAFEFMLNFG